MDDLLIKGGTVFDGTGTAGVTADVVVNDGRITAVGKSGGKAAKVVDAGHSADLVASIAPDLFSFPT